MGDKALSIGGAVALRYPIERGIITDWHDMELLWQHVFESELRTKSEEKKVLMTDAVHTPVGNREKMTQVRESVKSANSGTSFK